MLKTRELFAGLYALEDEWVRQFLVIGEERALLFDAGFADSGVLETVRALTELPIDVVMTHGDPDHSGGLADFGSCRMNAGDWLLVKDGSIALAPLDEGEIVACGGYRFRVIAIPGHTAGSLAFYDEAKGILLGGDSVQSGGPIFMFGGHRNLDAYIASLEKLERLIPANVTVLPCHSACPIDAGFITRDLADARALRDGALASDPHPALPCRVYHGEATDFLF